MYVFFQNLNKNITVEPKGKTVSFECNGSTLTLNYSKEFLHFTNKGVSWKEKVSKVDTLANHITNLVNTYFNLMSIKGF